MTATLILKFVEFALSLALSELDGSDLERTLVDIIRKGLQTYEDYKGKPLDPQLVGLLKPL